MVLLLPAAGAALMFFFGRKLEKKYGQRHLRGLCGAGVCVVSAGGAGSSPTADSRTFERVLFTWLGSGTDGMKIPSLFGGEGVFRVNAGILLDPLSAVWLLFVTGVGFLIHLYSVGYMAHEGGYYRFFGYMNLFMFSMLTLVLANNYLMMFVGWEGVGLCSYLLIGFYFDRHSASTAANKAFITNRIGDAGVILGALTIFWMFGTFDFVRVTDMAHKNAASLMGQPIVIVGDAGALPRRLRQERRSFRSTSGCRTPWRAPRRSRHSSTRRRW